MGVELFKFYMEKYWKFVILLFILVMFFGWFIMSVFIMWLVLLLNWIESLVVVVCVMVIDLVLVLFVVGKGKFVKRVLKYLRDFFLVEFGCNDGMVFLFVYLVLYLIYDKLNVKVVFKYWFLYIVLYECIFGVIYGFIIGYMVCYGIKYVEKYDLIDRESFLVFYFVLVLFVVGFGSILGFDDLLVGFVVGVGFLNDGWFM